VAWAWVVHQVVIPSKQMISAWFKDMDAIIISNKLKGATHLLAVITEVVVCMPAVVPSRMTPTSVHIHQ